MYLKNGVTYCLLLMLILVNSACSPYVRVKKDLKEYSVNEAIIYADKVVDNMYDKLDNKAIFTSIINNTLIPIAASTLGLGLTGASTQLLTGMSIGGATLYSIGAVNTNKAFDAIYIKGINGVICTKRVALAYKMPDNDFLQLKTLMAELDYYIILSRLCIDVFSNQPPSDDLKKVIDSSNKSIDSATTFAGDAYKSIYSSSLQGNNIVVAVDSIIQQVNDYVQKNQTTVDQSMLIAQNIGKVAANFKQINSVPAVQTSALLMAYNAKVENRVAVENYGAIKALGVKDETIGQTLANSLSHIEVLTKQISLILAKFSKIEISADLKGCGITVDDIAVNLKILPSDKVSIKKGGHVISRISVSGGKWPYTVILTNSRPNSPVIDNVQNGTNMLIQVTTNDNTDADIYNLLITDAAGNNATAVLTVENAQPAPAPVVPAPAPVAPH